MGNDGGLDDIFECKIERKAGYMEQKWTQHRAARPQVGGCLTAITVTGSAEDGHVLPLETFDELAHALPGVFRGMFGYPQGVVKTSLNWVRISASNRLWS
jgi:hypothetical protein